LPKAWRRWNDESVDAVRDCDVGPSIPSLTEISLRERSVTNRTCDFNGDTRTDVATGLTLKYEDKNRLYSMANGANGISRRPFAWAK
jgi:hypothetical protein